MVEDRTSWAGRRTPSLTRFRRSPREAVVTVIVAVLLYLAAGNQEEQIDAVLQAFALLIAAYFVVPLGEVVVHAFRAPTQELQLENQRLAESLRRVSAELTSLRREQDAIVNVRPRITCDGVRDAVFTYGRSVGPHPHRYRVRAWQLWFRNKPVSQSQDATALNVTAELEFWDSARTSLVRCFGVWAVTKIAEDVEWESLENSVRLSPVHEWGKLVLLVEIDSIIRGDGLGFASLEQVPADERAQQHEPRAYVLPQDSSRRGSFPPDERYEVGPTVRQVKVTLNGLNVPPTDYLFSLTRDRDGRISTILQE